MKKDYRTYLVRGSGVVLVATLIWNLQWSLFNLNTTSPLMSVFAMVFLGAVFLVTVSGLIVVINNWSFALQEPRKLLKKKPVVGIIIPTYGESIDIVVNTVNSVFNQSWPKDKMVVVVSDDAWSDELRGVMNKLGKLTKAELVYHRPPRKNHPDRKGEAKAGNLNSALALIQDKFPQIEFVETRDADDLVGSRNFLSYCLRELIKDRDLSFVQTIKTARHSKGDPFGNQETVFYRVTMPTRSTANAAFPCGSGLVWRVSELNRIGGFPAWNLVEDLHSGYEVLQLGGKGCYLETVGAVAQIAPEDIPNFYKQRGTWAIDTLRLFLWRNPILIKGLSFRQKLQFLELQLAYVLSVATIVFVVTLVLSLGFDIHPVDGSRMMYFVNSIIVLLSAEMFFYTRARGISYRKQWLARQVWLGLTHVYFISLIKAIMYGPDRKPAYKVTRKFHKFGWYWREVLPQMLIIASLSVSIVMCLIRQDNIIMYAPLIYWAAVLTYGFSRVVINSLYGVSVREKVSKLATLITARMLDKYTLQPTIFRKVR
jgi:cellulose synthase (UDP-forming)